jgi:hypothetical protein
MTHIAVVVIDIVSVMIFVAGFVLLLVSWQRIKRRNKAVPHIWIRWRRVFVGVMVPLSLIAVILTVLSVYVWPVEQSVNVQQAELVKGKVVDLTLAHGSGNPCYYENEFPLTGLCLAPSIGWDSHGRTVQISTRTGYRLRDEAALHLGESEVIEGLGRVTLVAFEDLHGSQGVRLLVVPDETSTWLVVKSANIPQSELAKGQVVDVRFDQPTFLDALSTRVSARFADSKYYAGLDTGTVSVKFSRDYPLDDVSVSLRLGESERVEGVGTVTLVAFENIDWEQGFKLLIVPEST